MFSGGRDPHRRIRRFRRPPPARCDRQRSTADEHRHTKTSTVSRVRVQHRACCNPPTHSYRPVRARCLHLSATSLTTLWATTNPRRHDISCTVAIVPGRTYTPVSTLPRVPHEDTGGHRGSHRPAGAQFSWETAARPGAPPFSTADDMRRQRPDLPSQTIGHSAPASRPALEHAT